MLESVVVVGFKEISFKFSEVTASDIYNWPLFFEPYFRYPESKLKTAVLACILGLQPTVRLGLRMA